MVDVKNGVGQISPHGGSLVNRILSGQECQEVKARAKELKKIALNARTFSDLELLSIGAVSPLEGFMVKKDYEGVINDMRLSSGVPWTLPITLAVFSDEAKELREGENVALLDSRGDVVGILKLEEKFDYDKKKEAMEVYRTDEDRHPELMARVQGEQPILGNPRSWSLL